MLPPPRQHRLLAGDGVGRRLCVHQHRLGGVVGTGRAEELLGIAALWAALARHQLPQCVQLPAACLTHPPALGDTQGDDVVPRAGRAPLLREELAGAALKRGDLLLRARAAAADREEADKSAGRRKTRAQVGRRCQIRYARTAGQTR